MRQNKKAGGFLCCGLLAAAFFGACGRTGIDEIPVTGKPEKFSTGQVPVFEAAYAPAEFSAAEEGERQTLLAALESIAELERAGLFTRGLGLRESLIREKLGDPAGAVCAAFKELAWAYSEGAIQKAEIEQGLGNALALEGIPSRAAQAMLDFTRGQWTQAASALDSLETEEEPDSFFRWMILCCALELDRGDRQSAAAYKAIRARYAQFPEYWYRGARFFSGAIAAQYAEQCVLLAPDGPYAGECRSILASGAGLAPEDGSVLRLRPEIESVILQSINQGEPAALAPLIPLVSLPDNAYTVYATGAMRALAGVPKFAEYFRELAGRSSGRLAERLVYICRGAP